MLTRKICSAVFGFKIVESACRFEDYTKESCFTLIYINFVTINQNSFLHTAKEVGGLFQKLNSGRSKKHFTKLIKSVLYIFRGLLTYSTDPSTRK